MNTYHILYKETPEAIFVTGVNIKANTMLEALQYFSSNYGKEPLVCYNLKII